jgi:hypothetical protein
MSQSCAESQTRFDELNQKGWPSSESAVLSSSTVSASPHDSIPKSSTSRTKNTSGGERCHHLSAQYDDQGLKCDDTPAKRPRNTLHSKKVYGDQLEWQNTLDNGEIHVFKTVNDKETLIRKEFAQGDPDHGQIQYFDGNTELPCRIEFAEGHREHKEIQYPDHTTNSTRVEFAEGHRCHNEIHYYDELAILLRKEYAECHDRHGEIRYYDYHDKIRIEYAKGHKQHGKIHFVNLVLDVNGKPIE